MSFPRAKLQRFNDVMNSVPSPTKYDPKIGDKVKGGCILKGETKPSNFSDTASAASSKSCQTPVFRTPQMPRKHNCLGTSEKGSHSSFKSISLKSEDLEFLHHDGELEELKALRVECSNKTETINDLEKHIQELKTQISDHEKSKMKLEAYISKLEIAKSNLECIRDNETCEQISKLQNQLEEMEKKIDQLTKNKEELLTKLEDTEKKSVKLEELNLDFEKKLEDSQKSNNNLKELNLDCDRKMEELEKKNNKLEESNLDCERKIISLEGTIEQLEMEHRNKEKLLAELKQKEEIYKMNHQVSIECLKGKISTLENEIKEMDSNKSKNEATIFGLETQISNLNCLIEKLKNEKTESESSLKEFKTLLEEKEIACKTHNDTIMGLEMELVNRIKEIKELKESNELLKTEMGILEQEIDKGKTSFEEKIKELVENHDKRLKEMSEKHEEDKKVLEFQKKDLESKSAVLANSHAKEILQLQNEYESKLLAQMQENTEKINVLQSQLDERDVLLKQSQVKYMKIFAEWENKLQEAEILVSKLESDHLDNLKEVRENFTKKLRMVEINSSKAIDMKNKEIDILTEQYKEILGEVKELLKDLEKKDLEIKNISSTNNNLNSRLKLMLEEIKLLNKENETKTENLKKMTTKYNEEFSKNEQLSCKLGELDSKITQLKEELSYKIEEFKKNSEELRKTKNLCDRIQNKKLDLETTVGDLQEKINRLIKDLNYKKAKHEEEIKKANDELGLVKTHCRNFEIVMGNTRKSLEAVRERLIESENEVEKLNGEKIILEKQLGIVEKEKSELRNKYEDMLETKSDLEATLDEYLTNNKDLLEKCKNFESLCDEFEMKIIELTKINTELETEKQNNIHAMNALIKNQELQMIETERETLDQVEKVSQMLTEKLEFFMKFSTEKVQNLMAEVKALKTENQKATESLKVKTYDYDNLMTDNEILKTTVEITVKESEDLKKRCEEYVSELKEKENSLSKLNLENTKIEEKLIDKERQFSKLIKECEILKNEVGEKIDELDQEKELRHEMESQINNLKSELDEYEIKTEKKDGALREVEKKISQLELAIKEKDAELASCQEEKIICMQEIQSLSTEKEDLLMNIKKFKRKMIENEKLIEEFRENKLQFEEESFKCKTRIEELLAEKCNLSSELSVVKNENKKLKEGSETLEHIEERKNYYKNNCQRLEKLCAELTEENANVKNDFDEIHSLLQEKDKKLEELKKRNSDLESLIGPFREQLEQYENERLLIENDREQLRKQHLEQAAKLGHQNLKQKIQHVVKLKNTLLETKKENEKLLLEKKYLKKKVQKLQEELGQDPKRLFIKGKRPPGTPFKEKENTSIMTPTTNIITAMSVKQEPMSPGSPLRNRNQ